MIINFISRACPLILRILAHLGGGSAYSLTMAEQVVEAASAKCLVPLDLFRGKYYRASHAARAVFILGSVGSSASDEVVSRRDIDLNDDDKDILSNLGLPPDRWNDLNVLLARNKQAEESEYIVGHEISEPGNELSCEYVLKMLQEVLKNNADKDGGRNK